MSIRHHASPCPAEMPGDRPAADAPRAPHRHRGQRDTRGARVMLLATVAALWAGSLAAAPAEGTPAPKLADRYKNLIEFQAPVVALTHAELWRGDGQASEPDMTVIVRQGRIEAIGPSASTAVPDGALVRDLAGMSLTPGFVMVHEHLFYPLNRGSYGEMFNTFPALYLAGGATTIRTAGSMSPYADLNLKQDIASGQAIGPDMDVTAPFFNGQEPFVMQVQRIGSAKQTRDMVAYWASEGATSYKGYMTLRRDHLGVLIEEAHKRKQKVTAHLCGVTYREAATLGIDNLEHGFMVASDFVPGKQPDECPGGGKVETALNALAVDSPEMASLQRFLIDRKVAITSTLTVFETFASGRPIAPAGALDLLIPELKDNYLSRWSALQQKPNVWAEVLPKEMKWEKQFFDAGGLLLAGTDPTGYGGVVPGFSNVRQVELLEEAGFSRAQALQISTRNGAVFLGREAEVGTIAVGKRADLIAYAAALSKDAQGLRKIVWTMKAGVAFNRARILAANKGKVGLE